VAVGVVVGVGADVGAGVGSGVPVSTIAYVYVVFALSVTGGDKVAALVNVNDVPLAGTGPRIAFHPAFGFAGS
jgi:hypothetical protein